MAQVRDLGLDRRCFILAGVGPVKSLRALEHMQQRSARACTCPTRWSAGCAACPADRVADEGLALCSEIIGRSTQIPGVAGVHVMAFGWEDAIPEILDARRARPPRSAPGPRSGACALTCCIELARLATTACADRKRSTPRRSSTSALEAATDSAVDLTRLRVVCDWIQYRQNFRDPVADCGASEPWAIDSPHARPGPDEPATLGNRDRPAAARAGDRHRPAPITRADLAARISGLPHADATSRVASPSKPGARAAAD